jgi:hypothetical protein
MTNTRAVGFIANDEGLDPVCDCILRDRYLQEPQVIIGFLGQFEARNLLVKVGNGDLWFARLAVGNDSFLNAAA